MPFKQHHAWFLAPAWGHMTSANALIVRMLELNPELVITAVIHAMVGDKADANLAQYPNVAWERLKLVKAGDSEIGTLLGTAVMKTATAQLSEVWIETLKDACSGNQTWPKPTALIVDQAGSLATLLESKSIVGPNCQTLMHWTPSASCFYGFLAPSTEFGFSNWEEITDKYYNDETLRKGRSREQIQEQVCQAKNGSDELNGSVTKVPGVKDMYDYEREMGNCPSPPGLALMLGQMVNLSKQVNGIVITSSMAIEGPALEACSKYRKIYPVGIQIAPRGWTKGGLPIVDETLRIFLNKQGKQEVIFISFGSVFFPATAPQYVAIMLSVLEELNFPFVFLLGGIMASSAIPSEMISEINNRGIGFIYNKWLDQQAVLQHPSVGWFLTHGGWNSEGESLAQGVPMIGWPMAQSDQAINVALAATRDKPVAYELMQIRQGEAKAKAMRGGETITGNDESVKKEFMEVFTKARGEEGRVLRRNAEELGEELRVEKEGKADDVVRELAFI